MRRREFLGVLSGAAATWPVAALAQQPGPIRRIGVLMPFPPTSAEVQMRVRAFKEKLQSRGWASGVNIQIDERWTTDDMDLIRAAAANLVELSPDAIFAVGGRVVPILMKMTRTIPIVAPSSDPVALGWAQSLARPGGNVTGFGGQELSVIGKALQTLKEIAPKLTRVGIIYNPDNPTSAHFVRWFDSAARALGLEPQPLQVHGFADIERAIAHMAEKPDGSLFFPLDLTLLRFMERTTEAVLRYSVPAIYSERPFVVSGGLAYYGVDRVDLFRQCATYVDRILRGEKAGDLPYQQPTKFELVINLKTAKVLGLTIPPALLATADEVIE